MRRALTAILAILAAGLIAAEPMKIGYVDFDQIMSDSRDAQDAQRILDNDRQTWLSQADDMKQEINRLRSEYDSRKMILSDAGKREAEQKISTKEQELKDFLQDIFGDTGRLAEKNNQLLEPIMTKVRQAVEKVAEDNGYAMILTSDALVYSKTSLGLDITPLVIDEMNKLGVQVTDPDNNANNNTSNPGDNNRNRGAGNRSGDTGKTGGDTGGTTGGNGSGGGFNGSTDTGKGK
jgi:outer membrane protein